MKQDEVEKLARDLMPSSNAVKADLNSTVSAHSLRALCDHILSGDIKREIENAAFERAAEKILDYKWSIVPSHAAEMIRSIIQPPAQKENGE